MREWIECLEIHNTTPPYYIADGIEVPFSFIKGKKIKNCIVHEYVRDSSQENNENIRKIMNKEESIIALKIEEDGNILASTQDGTPIWLTPPSAGTWHKCNWKPNRTHLVKQKDNNFALFEGEHFLAARLRFCPYCGEKS